jgi:arylsulfatase
MGDDVGWLNIGAYHRGIMSGKTPNLDKLASHGMMFTDYYAEASCTAGRVNFITGELSIRTGLTTVGQAGADVGLPAQAVTLATALKALGYETGQFGKNHLGDWNKYLPCVHGFDEFFGYLYHLDAMSDPYWYSFPNDPAYRDKVGPRNLVHCWATDTDDRPSSHVGARSANRRSWMRVPWLLSPTCPTCRTCTTSRRRPSTT